MNESSARRLCFLKKWLGFGAKGFLICVGAVVVDISLIPRGNVKAAHLDVILVLGQPAELDGSIKGEALERTNEAVRQYRSGIAPVILFTGGAAGNLYIESDAMARHAVAEGVPIEAIVRERESINTIQNIANAIQIMRAHSWTSAQIISSHPHLWRASLIVEAVNRLHPELAIHWVDHDSPWPPYYLASLKIHESLDEALKCVMLQATGIKLGNQMSCDALHDEARSGCLASP